MRNPMNSVAGNDNFWNTIVAAYQNAVQRRGITAASIGLTPNGYLKARIQQRLLLDAEADGMIPIDMNLFLFHDYKKL